MCTSWPMLQPTSRWRSRRFGYTFCGTVLLSLSLASTHLQHQFAHCCWVVWCCFHTAPVVSGPNWSPGPPGKRFLLHQLQSAREWDRHSPSDETGTSNWGLFNVEAEWCTCMYLHLKHCPTKRQSQQNSKLNMTRGTLQMGAHRRCDKWSTE